MAGGTSLAPYPRSQHPIHPHSHDGEQDRGRHSSIPLPPCRRPRSTAPSRLLSSGHGAAKRHRGRGAAARMRAAGAATPRGFVCGSTVRPPRYGLRGTASPVGPPRWPASPAWLPALPPRPSGPREQAAEPWLPDPKGMPGEAPAEDSGVGWGPGDASWPRGAARGPAQRAGAAGLAHGRRARAKGLRLAAGRRRAGPAGGGRKQRRRGEGRGERGASCPEAPFPPWGGEEARETAGDGSGAAGWAQLRWGEPHASAARRVLCPKNLPAAPKPCLGRPQDIFGGGKTPRARCCGQGPMERARQGGTGWFPPQNGLRHGSGGSSSVPP